MELHAIRRVFDRVKEEDLRSSERGDGSPGAQFTAVVPAERTGMLCGVFSSLRGESWHFQD